VELEATRDAVDNLKWYPFRGQLFSDLLMFFQILRVSSEVVPQNGASGLLKL
jgi:hypothetical protein